MLKKLIPTLVFTVALVPATALADFERRIRYSVGTEPMDVVEVDLDNDGVLDLATADYEADEVSVLIGDGDGGFEVAASYPAGNGPISLAAADFDLDGDMDLATANEIDDTVTILHGDGSGVLASPVAYPAGDTPRAIAAGLINGDNRHDLIVVNSHDNNVALLVAMADGGFASPLIREVGNGPVAVALADVDQNGTLDVMVANRDDGTVSVLIGNGNGVIAPAMDYAVGNGPVALLAADANGDGIPDIIAANQDDDEIAVLVNTGSGLFRSPSSHATSKGPMDLTMGDFSGDCVMDLAVVSDPPGKVTIMHGDGGGGFSVGTETYFVDTQSNALAAADFNNDLRMDLAVARTKADDVSLALAKPTSSAGAFYVRSADMPSAVRTSPAASVFEAPFDTEQGSLSDGASRFYVVEHQGGIALALSVHKNEAADAVRLGFNDGDFDSAPVDELLSEVVVDSIDVPADGTAPAVVTVIPKDAAGIQLGTGLKLGVDGQFLHPASLAGAIKDHGNGVYSFEVVSGSPGSAVLQISVEGLVLAHTPVLQFVNP
jgi:hypothetical protein